MEIDRFDKLPGRSAAFAAAAAVTLSALFTGTAVGHAEPYGDDDDTGTSQTSDDGGGMSESGGGMNTDEPSGGGMNTDEPSGGGMHDSGGMESPGGGMEEPGGGMNTDEPSGGGMHDSGGMESPGGGMEEPGGGMNTDEPSGGGMHDSGGGMNTDEPRRRNEHRRTLGWRHDAAVRVRCSGTGRRYRKRGLGGLRQSSVEATSEEISSYRESIESSFTSSTFTTSSVLSSPVTQWEFAVALLRPGSYRSCIHQPVPDSLQVMYDYGGKPQLFTVPPCSGQALDVPNAGVYNFA